MAIDKREAARQIDEVLSGLSQRQCVDVTKLPNDMVESDDYISPPLKIVGTLHCRFEKHGDDVGTNS